MINDSTEPLLRTRGLRKEYGRSEGLVRAVDGVDLDVGLGETVAVTGPSGWDAPSRTARDQSIRPWPPDSSRTALPNRASPANATPAASPPE